MTPQDQEFLHDEDNEIQGDCARAVLASLLDLPRDQVPHFAQRCYDPHQKLGFWGLIDQFCASKGFALVESQLIYEIQPGQSIFHYMSGPSPRGTDLFHAVVGLNGEVIFDPHPSRAGLAGDPKQWKCRFLKPITQPEAAQKGGV